MTWSMRPAFRPPAALAALAALASLATALAACGAESTTVPAPTTPRMLQAMPETVWVQPGQTGVASFLVLGPNGTPLAGAPVAFAILDDPNTPDAEAQGATLAAVSGVADATGMVDAHFTAGMPAEFQVRATTANATAEVAVVVAQGLVSSVDVAPFFPPPSRAAAVASTIQISFFDNGACRGRSLRHPPQPVRATRSVPAAGAVSRFQFVSTAVAHAIVGRAVDARGALVALGCVDLPGPTLVAGVAVQVALPLSDAGPDPAGTFAATTSLAIAPALDAEGTLAATWGDLTDCPLDPAQRWLDCALDALGAASDADPLDCVPATAPGGDGPLGDALAPLRGAFLPGPDGKPTACRGAKTAQGEVSVDAVAQGLYGTPLPAAVLALEAAADDAAHLFDAMKLRSVVVVRAGASLDAVEVTHTLDEVVFARGDRTSTVALQPLGLPQLVATTTGDVTGDILTLPEQAFTLRLGAAARAGFGALALAPRGLPADAHALVAALADLAHDDDGVAKGCAALDAALCARAGSAPGCLALACARGLDALTARLDASFAAADGDGYDLYLTGSAPLLDTHGNGLADRLGDLQVPAQAGTWAVQLRPRTGRRALAATWEAVRVGN
jgi:hypothetical protein